LKSWRVFAAKAQRSQRLAKIFGGALHDGARDQKKERAMISRVLCVTQRAQKKELAKVFLRVL
jgi:hypothetical protein